MTIKFVNGYNVRVSFNDMGREWQAILDDYYDGAPDTAPGLATLVGHGNTEQDAIDDLFTQKDDDFDDEVDEYDDSMDGDHESALASAGWGTDEDYGGGCDQY